VAGPFAPFGIEGAMHEPPPEGDSSDEHGLRDALRDDDKS
jgi:hypothetical protein